MVQLDPEFAIAYYNRAEVWLQLNEWDKAKTDLTSAKDMGVDIITGFNYNYENVADFEQKTGIQLPSDIAVMLTSHSVKASGTDIHIVRGINYAKNGKFDLAIMEFGKVIKIDPYYAEAYCKLGIVYDIENEYDRAIENYTKAIQLKPDYVEAYNNRGIVYGEKGELNLAIKDFDTAIELERDYVKAYNNRGAVYRDKGDLDKAIEDCSKAIQLDSNYADPYNNRGAAYRNKGKVDLAIEDYDRAIELNPYFFKAYYNRGIAYHDKREYDLAIKNYSKATELNPKHSHPYYNRGNTYLLKGDFDLAIKDYNSAIELNPELAHAYYNRSEVWLNQHQWEKAKTDLLTAKEMGLDIAAAFRNGYKNVEAFEQKHKVKLPEDIAVLVREGFRYRYPMKEKALNSEGKPLESPEVFDLMERFSNATTPLGEYVKIEPYFGIETVPTEVFVVGGETRDQLIAEHPSSIDILKPFLQGTEYQTLADRDTKSVVNFYIP